MVRRQHGEPDQTPFGAARDSGEPKTPATVDVTVKVPAADAVLMEEVAAALCAGGEDGYLMRECLARFIRHKRATTGRELVAFFRASPLVGADLDLERDRSPGRPIEL